MNATALLLCCTLLSAGMAWNDDLIVLATDQPLADAVLQAAEEYRREIALRLFGRNVRPHEAPTIINAAISDTWRYGLTWPIDRPERKYHSVWLRATRASMMGRLLKHEMVHCLLAGKGYSEREEEQIAERLAPRLKGETWRPNVALQSR